MSIKAAAAIVAAAAAAAGPKLSVRGVGGLSLLGRGGRRILDSLASCQRRSGMLQIGAAVSRAVSYVEVLYFEVFLLRIYLKILRSNNIITNNHGFFGWSTENRLRLPPFYVSDRCYV